ncbi:ATP-binding protein [Myxococcus sp. K15C18031901]|uniref:sensor histidine kinase n=1 Tax=Myxococcus dinghuensis TaxID=2906761 RepID=UPI0020A810F2|nr:ATP-binding protein [Myxococcus dinghuensis]MCP3098884.1 ATP-binding protein [Myxococcus dinghuensis]
MTSGPSTGGMDARADASWMNSQLKRFTLLACILIHGLLVSSLWGRWHDIAVLTVGFTTVTTINVVLARDFFSRHSKATESARFVLNMVATVFYGVVSDWELPMWLYLPLNALWADRFVDPSARPRLVSMLALVAGAALLDGCPPEVPISFVLLSLLTYFISEGRVVLTHHAMQELARQHEQLAHAHAQLDLAHARAREQERLTSLGMLAAGVAHEINNPMSYVKSNVNALLIDLRACKELPPELREYVDDVLPATADGIRRVVSIVADLRRFARGDPGAMEEYDLNEELAVAMRITHSQLKPRCEVQMALGELPRLLGRPGQLAQVVVNLLMNAAQAMPDGGRITLSTHMEGDEAVLRVSDSGVGMSPEVLARLFQPFFTTKRAGEGTGMGLAVVHGIVTSHKGRIAVESPPTGGTTFTIHLPRIPPLDLRLPDAPDGALPPLPTRSRPDAA